MLHIRPATVRDVALLRNMLCELAEYERQLERVTIREEDLAGDGFGVNPRFDHSLPSGTGSPPDTPCFLDTIRPGRGADCFWKIYSCARRFRRRAIGKALLAAVARTAVEEHCYGIHWEVLDWNEKAIELSKQLGATFRDQWRPVLLADEALRRLAEKAL